jgi:hypothetical protein
MRLPSLASLAAISTLTIGAGAHAQELPEGPGKALVQTACSQCHSLDVVLRQRRSREDWMEVLSRMVGNGAELSDDDYNQALEYLATYLGPASGDAPANGLSPSMTPSGKK